MGVAPLVAAALCLGMAACGGGTTTSSAPSPPGSQEASIPAAAPSPSPTKRTSPPPTSPPPSVAACPPVDETAFDAGQVVPALANIFGAGHAQAPMPGGGGAGQVPPVWVLPPGTTALTFPCVEGTVNPIRSNPDVNGPEGNGTSPTRISSFQGISGIVDNNNAMFLTGVFLTDAEPTDPAPEPLDFTDTESFNELSPLVGQTFLIGDGIGRRYKVPAGATRLFVGFADAYFWVGKPGYYGNNSGQIEVTVAVQPG